MYIMKRIYLLFIFFSAFFLNVNAQKGISETELSPKIKVGPVKPRHGYIGILQAKQGNNILPHLPGGGCGKRADYRPHRKTLYKGGDIKVAWPEILSPLRDAVGFIHADHADDLAGAKR